jgi:hypothetical protein|tara:strand:+ start:2709 stop:2984 length:276 start_codon:yes stop_codon:yes gene_type:complete
MKINTKDKIVLDVIKKMDERSLVGQEKYGQTMDQEVKEGMKDLNDFLDDTQEEIMDALLYIQAAKKCLKENLIYTGVSSISKKHRKPGSWT